MSSYSRNVAVVKKIRILENLLRAVSWVLKRFELRVLIREATVPRWALFVK